MLALRNLLPFIFALLALIMFSMTLNFGNGDPVALLSPLEALNGLAFMLAFGLGVPQWLSLLLSLSLLLLVCWSGYRLGKKVQTLFKA